jgi:hypothetical protein
LKVRAIWILGLRNRDVEVEVEGSEGSFPVYVGKRFFRPRFGGKTLSSDELEAIGESAPSELPVKEVRVSWRGNRYGVVDEDHPIMTEWFSKAREVLEKIKERKRAERREAARRRRLQEKLKKARRVEWEILPPEPGGRIPRKIGKLVGKRSQKELERLQLLATLGPTSWAIGRYLGRRQYIVALFERVAVAECEERGNALYLAPSGSWEEIFRRTKPEARALGARRIVHRGNWKRRLEEALTGE